MRRTIWKFVLASADEQMIEMPLGARVLTAREQGDDICVWAEVEPDERKEPRRFLIFGTGHPVPFAHGEYVGTAIFRGGSLVFHVYEMR